MVVGTLFLFSDSTLYKAKRAVASKNEADDSPLKIAALSPCTEIKTEK